MKENKRVNPSQVRRAILRSYAGHTRPSLRAFLTARTLLLPLNQFDEVLPAEGTILEVGCGHGIVAQYLARSRRKRHVVAIEPDSERLKIARAAGGDLPNVEWRSGYFSAGQFVDLDAIVFLGVLYLINDAGALDLLEASRSSLRSGGRLILSDTFLDGSFLQRFQFFRERCFRKIKFTKGQVLNYRTEDQWKAMVKKAGFDSTRAFNAPVFLHSTFNWMLERP